MPLVPDYDSKSEADVDGVHFQMKAPSDAVIRCSLHPDVFKDLVQDDDSSRLKFYLKHQNKLRDVASKMHESRSQASPDKALHDAPIEMRYRDLHFWGFSVTDFQG